MRRFLRQCGFAAAVTIATTVLLPVNPAAAATVTVDNATAGRFTASSNWGTSAWSSQRYGENYHVRSAPAFRPGGEADFPA